MTTEGRSKIIYAQGEQKPKRGLDGLYHFTCEVCLRLYTAKNVFSKTCSQLCRNIKNYNARSAKFGEQISNMKKNVYNIKVLCDLVGKGINEPSADLLNVMKFNLEVKGNLETVNNTKFAFLAITD